MKVLGIDPGTAATGFGVVTRAGDGAVSLVECGVIRTSSGTELASRLRDIYEGVCNVLDRAQPTAVAVEGVFYARNVHTSLVLGHARGVILLAAALRDLPVFEYAPAEVKNAITGTGRAAKEQVQYMVQTLLRLKTPPRPADAADAVAIAICHCNGAGVADLRAPALVDSAELLARAARLEASRR